MITYLLQVSTAWCVFILVYHLILKQEKYFSLNRAYLLGSVFIGLLLPLIAFMPTEIEYVAPSFVPEISSVYHSQIDYISSFAVANADPIIPESTTWSWSTFLLLFYFAGVLIMLVRSVGSAIKLIALIRKGKAIKHKGYTEIILDSDQLPFSFFRYICLGKLDIDLHLKEKILNHEMHHLNSLHSIDILLIELIKIIFWWNPIIYMFKKAIEENHEFSADAKVIEKFSRKEYCSLLMKTTFPGVNLQLSNPFFQTFIKKRINMMYQKDSKKYHLLKYSFSIIAFAFLFILFAGPVGGQKIKWDEINGLINLGEEIKSEEIIVSMDDKILVEGEDYRLNEETGKLVLNNTITETKRPIKVDFNKNDSSEKKTPIRVEIDNTKSVEKQIPLKIDSKKSDQTKTKFQNVNAKGKDCLQGENGVYFKTEVAPAIVGCENDNWEDALYCARTKLCEYANSIKKFPAEALKKGFQGLISYKLVIDESGEVVDYKVPKYIKKYEFGIHEEGQRIIAEIKKDFKFSPASCNGQKVKSQISFSFRYQIGESEKPYVEIKDSKTVNNINQSVTINHIGQKGGMSFQYRSNMNVPSEVTITDPDGQNVYQETFSYMFRSLMDHTVLDKPKNGNYTITVIQDGVETSSMINVNVFKHN